MINHKHLYFSGKRTAWKRIPVVLLEGNRPPVRGVCPARCGVASPPARIVSPRITLGMPYAMRVRKTFIPKGSVTLMEIDLQFGRCLRLLVLGRQYHGLSGGIKWGWIRVKCRVSRRPLPTGSGG